MTQPEVVVFGVKLTPDKPMYLGFIGDGHKSTVGCINPLFDVYEDEENGEFQACKDFVKALNDLRVFDSKWRARIVKWELVDGLATETPLANVSRDSSSAWALQYLGPAVVNVSEGTGFSTEASARKNLSEAIGEVSSIAGVPLKQVIEIPIGPYKPIETDLMDTLLTPEDLKRAEDYEAEIDRLGIPVPKVPAARIIEPAPGVKCRGVYGTVYVITAVNEDNVRLKKHIEKPRYKERSVSKEDLIKYYTPFWEDGDGKLQLGVWKT